jgi:D-alanine--D-alanine ligase
MQKIKVGVLRGGPSSEYDISLKTGGSILKNLPEEKYDTNDIFISKEGEWHFRGIPIAPEKVLDQVDVVFNAMHGEYGEDGTVQQLLDAFVVPYNGSTAFSSALGMNKLLTKQGLEEYDINTPEYTIVESSKDLEKDIFDIFRSFKMPAVVKPVSSGSSIGITIAKSFDDLRDGVYKALGHSPKVLIEEYISGREVTCGVIERFRDEDFHALMPVEIVISEKADFFDHTSKCNGDTQATCPAQFDRVIKDEIQRLAIEAHKALGLRHYSRSDFIVSPRGIYFLEVNTLPELNKDSLLPKALEAGGTKLPEFLDHLVSLALDNK